MNPSESTADDSPTMNIGGHVVPVGSPAAAMLAQLPPLVEVPAAPTRSATEMQIFSRTESPRNS